MRVVLNILLGLLMATPTAFGISRIGNGSLVSNALGFSMGSPQQYSLLQPLGGESIRLLNPTSGFSSLGQGLEMIDVRDFASEYPEFAHTSDESLKVLLLQSGWSAESSLCVPTYRKLNGSTQTVIIHWAEGKGIVLIANTKPSISRDVQKMIESFRLIKGDCQWK